MKMYKSFKAIERTWLCHRNSVQSFIDKWHVLKIEDEKKWKIVGYALLREVITEIMPKLDKLS